MENNYYLGDNNWRVDASFLVKNIFELIWVEIAILKEKIGKGIRKKNRGLWKDLWENGETFLPRLCGWRNSHQLN
jgi:hypothetical protein